MSIFEHCDMITDMTNSLLEQTIAEKTLQLTKVKQKVVKLHFKKEMEIQKLMKKNSEDIKILLLSNDETSRNFRIQIGELKKSSKENCENYQAKFIRLCKQVESLETTISLKETLLKTVDEENKSIKKKAIDNIKVIEEKVAKLEREKNLKDEIVHRKSCEILDLQHFLEEKSADLDRLSENFENVQQSLFDLQKSSAQSEAVLLENLLELHVKTQTTCKFVFEKEELVQALQKENDQLYQKFVSIKKKLNSDEAEAEKVDRLEAESRELDLCLKQKDLSLMLLDKSKKDVEQENRLLKQIIADKDNFIVAARNGKLQQLTDKDETIRDMRQMLSENAKEFFQLRREINEVMNNHVK